MMVESMAAPMGAGAMTENYMVVCRQRVKWGGREIGSGIGFDTSKPIPHPQ